MRGEKFHVLWGKHETCMPTNGAYILKLQCKYNTSLMWPDPLGTGAYRLEIVSTMPRVSGLVHIPNLFWPLNRCKTSVTYFASLIVICTLFRCLLDLVFSNNPYGPTAFKTKATISFGVFYWGERYLCHLTNWVWQVDYLCYFAKGVTPILTVLLSATVFKVKNSYWLLTLTENDSLTCVKV